MFHVGTAVIKGGPRLLQARAWGWGSSYIPTLVFSHKFKIAAQVRRGQYALEAWLRQDNDNDHSL